MNLYFYVMQMFLNIFFFNEYVPATAVQFMNPITTIIIYKTTKMARVEVVNVNESEICIASSGKIPK